MNGTFYVVHCCVTSFWSYMSSLRRKKTVRFLFVCLFFPQQMIVRIKTFLWFHLHSRVTKLHVGDEIVQIRLAEVCHLILLLNLLMLWFWSLKNRFLPFFSPLVLNKNAPQTHSIPCLSWILQVPPPPFQFPDWATCAVPGAIFLYIILRQKGLK